MKSYAGCIAMFLLLCCDVFGQTASVLPSATPLGSGPFKAIMEVDPLLSKHTVYRPNDMKAAGLAKMPIMAWGNGACAADGNAFRYFLTDIASHGYLIIANGPIGPDRAEFPPQMAAPKSGAGGQAKPPAIPAGVSLTPPTTTAQLIEAVDWAIAENGRKGSRYFGKLDTTKISVGGMSCGGIQAIEASVDPRVKTTIVANSGLMNPPATMSGSGKPVPKESLKLMHASVLYLSGDASDIAFANANDDFEKIDHIPVFRAYQKGIDHGGTYHDSNGGTFSKVTLAWLDWQLKGSKEAAKMFQGNKCKLCVDPKWVINKKMID